MRRERGITLIALVITIIVLIILAGISIQLLLGENGIITKAKKGKGDYEESKAREELTLVLGEAQILKYGEEGLTDTKLNEKLNEIGQVDEEDNTKIVVDGYIYIIDREELIIVDCLGKDDGIEIKYKITGNENWIKGTPNISIAVTVKNNNGTLDQSSITITKDGIDITSSVSINEGTFTLTTNASTVYTVSAKNSKGEQSTPRIIKVNAKIDNTPPTLTSVTATAQGMIIKIGAEATDNESGVKNYNYTISPTDGIPSNQTTGEFTNEQVITATKETTYTITVTATDMCDNESSKQTAQVTTVNALTLADAKELVNADTLQSYIGTKILDYNPEAGGIWRIFYFDEENYFGDGNGTLYLKRDYNEKITLNAYTGYASSDGGALMKQLNPMWRDYPTENANSIDLANEYVVSWLCDKTKWTSYKTEDAKYAIGAPSVEMYVRAYNVYHQNNVNGNALTCGIVNNKGYGVGKGSAGYGSDVGGLSNDFSFSAPTSNNEYSWLASPGYASNLSLMCVNRSVVSSSRTAVNLNNLYFCPIASIEH